MKLNKSINKQERNMDIVQKNENKEGKKPSLVIAHAGSYKLYF